MQVNILVQGIKRRSDRFKNRSRGYKDRADGDDKSFTKQMKAIKHN